MGPRDLPLGAHVLALAAALVVPGVEVPAPNVLSAAHLTRIADGLLYAATSRVPWATLLRRTFGAGRKGRAGRAHTGSPHARRLGEPFREARGT
jgi:hypothetical protein